MRNSCASPFNKGGLREILPIELHIMMYLLASNMLP